MEGDEGFDCVLLDAKRFQECKTGMGWTNMCRVDDVPTTQQLKINLSAQIQWADEPRGQPARTIMLYTAGLARSVGIDVVVLEVDAFRAASGFVLISTSTHVHERHGFRPITREN